MGVQRFDTVGHDSMRYPVPLRVKRHQRVDPGRLNTAPGPVRVLMSYYPLDTEANRFFSARLNRKLDIPAQETIGHQEKTFPGKKPLLRGEPIVKIGSLGGKQLIESRVGRKRFDRASC